MKGNRRNPYRVRVTVGYEIDRETGRSRQIIRTVGYFPSFEEANEALIKYHKDPLTFERGVTFAEIWRRWSAEKFDGAGKSLVASYTAAFRAVPMLHDMEFRKIRLAHLQNAVDTCGKNLPTLQNIKLIMRFMFEYAVKHDLVEKDYSEYVDLSKHRSGPRNKNNPVHVNFTEEEIGALWRHTEDPDVAVILMLIYSGLRIEEFMSLSSGDVDLSSRFISVREAKTEAGIRRVPIAAKTAGFWEARALPPETPGESRADTDARKFRARMKVVTARILGKEHLPHDTRHTTASLLEDAKVDLYMIKRILGHRIQDITENTYIHVTDEAFLSAIDSI